MRVSIIKNNIAANYIFAAAGAAAVVWGMGFEQAAKDLATVASLTFPALLVLPAALVLGLVVVGFVGCAKDSSDSETTTTTATATTTEKVNEFKSEKDWQQALRGTWRFYLHNDQIHFDLTFKVDDSFSEFEFFDGVEADKKNTGTYSINLIDEYITGYLCGSSGAQLFSFTRGNLSKINLTFNTYDTTSIFDASSGRDEFFVSLSNDKLFIFKQFEKTEEWAFPETLCHIATLERVK